MAEDRLAMLIFPRQYVLRAMPCGYRGGAEGGKMKAGAKYAAVIIVLATTSALTLHNADAIVDWGRHILKPVLGWEDIWVIPTILIVMMPPSLLAGTLIGLTSRTIRGRVPEKWRRWV
jgi:hypothetical protein